MTKMTIHKTETRHIVDPWMPEELEDPQDFQSHLVAMNSQPKVARTTSWRETKKNKNAKIFAICPTAAL